MVVLWAIASLYFSLWLVVRIEDERWGWAALNAFAVTYSFTRASYWWSRT
jgi:hypothetical protein